MKKYLFRITWLWLILLIPFGAPAQHAVKTQESVEIGGINQWIGAKGNDSSKPVLLFLHGGPGFSSRVYAKKFIKHLKKDFIVVQWDQRETGITAHWSPYSEALSLDLFHSDTEEVVNYVLNKFSKKKLYLVGFSWGGFLGLHFADQHPELLHAYISVSSMIHGNESEKLTLSLLKEKAANNPKALAELSKIKLPFTAWEDLYLQRKWTAYLPEGKSQQRKYPKSIFQEWSVKWMDIFGDASKVNYMETIPEIRCPIYFFVSNKDFVSNYTLAEKYFEGLKSDQKQLVWFEESSHEIPNQEPKKFSSELIKIAKQ